MPKAVIAGAALALALLTGCAATADPDSAAVAASQNDPDGLNGIALPAPYHLPDATLVDSRGDDTAVSDAVARQGDALTLLFFGYTHCPDICQAVMADITSAVTRLDPDEAAKVGMLFVTTDPERDTPTVLRKYLDRFNPDFDGLTGDLDQITAVGKGVHVAIEQGPKLPGGGYEITHSTPILLVTPDLSVPVLWTQETSAAKLAADLHTLLTDGVPDVSAQKETS